MQYRRRTERRRQAQRTLTSVRAQLTSPSGITPDFDQELLAGHARDRLAAWVTENTASLERTKNALIGIDSLTDAGLDLLESRLGGVNLYDSPHTATLTRINLALHARVLVRDGAVDGPLVGKEGEQALLDRVFFIMPNELELHKGVRSFLS